jgi:hypothetical protein
MITKREFEKRYRAALQKSDADNAKNEPFINRALAAYYKVGASGGHVINTEVVTHKRLTYVVLTGTRDVLAVYRVRNTGFLRRLTRWPKEIAP